MDLGLSSRPGTSVGASSKVPTLPLRADVLLSNTLFEELENGISEEFLKHYLGSEDLEEVDFLEIQVDSVTGAEGVECIGQLLPNLTQLRLNQSNLGSVRDLGTSLQKLQVLWLCRSSVQDLGGISVLPQLQELYVAFNDVSDLMPLSTHESIQILDLEGNLVEDFAEVQALEHVASLRELNLTMNPLWKQGGVSRADVFEVLPQLEMLDDMPRESLGGLELDDSDSDDSDIDEMDLPEFVEASELGAEPALRGSLSTVPEDDYQASSAVMALRRRAAAVARMAGEEADGSSEGTAADAASPLREAWGSSSCSASAPSSQKKEKKVPHDEAIVAVVAEEDLDCPEVPSPREETQREQPSVEKATWSEPASSAVAELHARLASAEHCARPLTGSATRMREREIDELPSGAESPKNKKAAATSTEKDDVFCEEAVDEPSEQDLILEGLKRAPRHNPSSWQTPSASARPASRCGTPGSGFQPGARRSSCALSSVASSASTMYRPSTASGLSELNSSRSLLSGASVVEFEGTSSDLTGGDDGSALVGTPLAAIRRRRQLNRAQGEEDMNIRTLMKRFEFIRERFHRGELLEEDEERTVAEALAYEGSAMRPCTPDVRVGPARLLEKGPAASPSKAKGLAAGARPPRPGSRAGAGGSGLGLCGGGMLSSGFGSPHVGEINTSPGLGAGCFMRTEAGAEVLTMEPIELS